MAPLLTLGLTAETHSGRVLARNRRFLRYRTPASLNLPGTTAQGLTNTQPSCEPHSPYTTLSQSSAVTSGDPTSRPSVALKSAFVLRMLGGEVWEHNTRHFTAHTM